MVPKSSQKSSPYRLSGVVICQNNAEILGRCLTSLRFCDEVVVVDGGSTDGSLAIAERYATRVVERPYRGTNDQKEFARTQARGEWVLNLDSDEWIVPQVAEKIQEIIQSDRFDGVEIPVKSFLGEVWLKRGGWWPNRQKRLFRRAKGYWDSTVEPHDCVRLEGRWGRLRGAIYHEPALDLTELRAKALRYGRIAAEKRAERGEKTSTLAAIFRPIWRFFRSYVLKGGFLDRRYGFELARISCLEGREKYRRG